MRPSRLMTYPCPVWLSRYIAIFIILIKFISLEDLPLVIGQGLITITFTIYLILAVMYFLYPREEAKKDS
ncbi:MAG: hypothetical protein WD889_02970 [Candidatus Colwellbacteria bacterium]